MFSACKKNSGPAAAEEAKKFCKCSSTAVKMTKESQDATNKALNASIKRAINWQSGGTAYKKAVKSTFLEVIRVLKLNY